MQKYILFHREVILVIKLQVVTTHLALKNSGKKINVFHGYSCVLKYVNGIMNL